LQTSEVVEIFTATTYRVYMLGFLPGFAYMGEVDARIATPRRSSPRTKTPKGSVGIAGKQTGIYPLESPGGWQIIGATDVELFTPESESQTFLQAGDTVKFYPQNR
jgi:inhibitor of KinA